MAPGEGAVSKDTLAASAQVRRERLSLAVYITTSF